MSVGNVFDAESYLQLSARWAQTPHEQLVALINLGKARRHIVHVNVRVSFARNRKLVRVGRGAPREWGSWCRAASREEAPTGRQWQWRWLEILVSVGGRGRPPAPPVEGGRGLLGGGAEGGLHRGIRNRQCETSHALQH